jgi:hypothetical protein
MWGIAMSRTVIAALALLGVAAPSVAHHSRAAFQLDQTTVLKTKIKAVRWSNPHVFFVGDVVNDKGQAEEWTFEGHSISGLVRLGWSKTTLNAGDQVQMVVNRHRDPSKHFGLVDHVVMADGAKMYSVGQPPRNTVTASRPPIAPSKDFSGNWRYQFPGTPEQVRQRILLGPEAPASDRSYTAKAQAQVKAYDANKNPSLTCEPQSLPYLLTTVYEYKWIRTSDRILIKKEQFIDADRTIHLNKSPTPPAGYRPNPLGYSVGRFEPDGTLVVETTGFSALRWGNNSGIDSSEKKRIVERYKLGADGLSLSLSYTVEDPVYFTSAVTGEGKFAKSADSEFAPLPPCDIKAARQHLEFE